MTGIKRGFTLVELLIVIAILGVLASIALVSFRSAQMRGRDVQRKSDLKGISNSLELFYADYAKYPDEVSGVPAGCPFDSVAKTGTACVWGESEFRDVDAAGGTKTTYFKVLPKDPTSYSYVYRVDATSQKYQLFAYLENSQDPGCLPSDNPDCTNPGVTISCGTKTCNFAITSPNTTPTDF
ncbi:MAG TPA: prepilin-type N-terminal cleavage/methylation domain-containing protein [Patescibacteria group bacterium]|nr:prepilin-type N-terminal cleavage/methylation domain-containing protein [Patescibacteria group bacterium]